MNNLNTGKIEIKDQSGSLIREGFLPGTYTHLRSCPFSPSTLDENFIIPHDKSGILSMVNSGPHSNYSSFMITNGPLPYFDRKYVAFGRLIQGQATLDRINGVKTRLERPTEAITITSAKLVDL